MTSGLAEDILRSLALDSPTPDEKQVCERLREQASTESEPARKAMLETLSVLLSLGYDHRERAECPFYPRTSVDQLSKDTVRELAAVAHVIGSRALRAKVLDVAWYLRACEYTAAKGAVEDYLVRATETLDSERWTESFSNIRRAVLLALSLGKKAGVLDDVLERVGNLALTVGAPDPKYFCARVMTLLQDYKVKNLPAFIKLAADIAAAATNELDYPRAIALLEVKRVWHQREKNASAVKDTTREIAGLHEKLADVFEKNGQSFIAAHHQEVAVKVWRSVGGAAVETKAAQVRLQAFQRQSLDEMKPFEHELDLSDSVAAAKELVANKPALEAILALASFSVPPPLSELRKTAEQTGKAEESIHRLFPSRVIGAGGRTVRRIDSPLTGATEDLIDEEARRDLSLQQSLIAMGAILPAVGQIQWEHGLTTAHLLSLTRKSTFVPPNREISFAKGLSLGFHGEFQLAAHLLMPQFENAVRHHLEMRGALVSNLPDSGRQNAADLGALLALDEAKIVLGEEELDELRNLLVEKEGTNLRNELAHGLIDDQDHYAHYIYFWWIVLRYVVVPFMTRGEPDA